MASSSCLMKSTRLGSAAPCGLLPRRIAKPFKAPIYQQARQTLCRVSEVDLETQVEAFMKRQAELESGAAFARSRDTNAVIGGDVVNDEAARGYCADIFEVLRTLKRTRDMSVAEVKLVVSIEDPRTRERRTQGMEDDRGVSRDEMAAALLEVAEGRVPRDRIALKCLHEEVTGWPFLERTSAMDGKEASSSNAAATSASTAPPSASSSSTSSPSVASAASSQAAAQTSPSEYASILKDADTVVKPYIMGQELRKGEKPQGLADMLPAWTGYSALYGITLIPVLLVVGTVLVLFYSSLK